MKKQTCEALSDPLRKLRRILVNTVVSAGISLGAYSASSQFVLTAIPGLPNVSSGSVAWGDYDNDGRLDFLLAGLENGSGMPKLSLWHNTGGGFSNVTATVAPDLPGIFDGAVAWGDYDNDGRLDFLVTGLTNVASHSSISQVWRNTGSGFTHVPVPSLPGVAESAVAWSDFDGDGRLDFLLSGTTNGDLSGAITQLWRNTGGGFTNVPIAGLMGTAFGSTAWGDFGNDGRPDFLVTGTREVSQLWRNTGNGFTNVAVPGLPAVFVSSVAWGDYDSDGLLDFLLEGQSVGGSISQLWRNTGDGFTNVPVPGLAGVTDGSVAWADYDNNGRLDFLITGLSNGVTHVSQLWRNTGSGFTNVPIPGLPGSFNNSLAWGDFDNDNRLDFLIAGTTPDGIVSQLWRNTAASSNAPPAPPTGLSASVSGSMVALTWSPPADDFTPPNGLSYNVRIGTTPGGSDVVAAPALSDGRLLMPQSGVARNGSATFHQLQPGRAYYWSVQAVDSGYLGSAFASEQQFTTSMPSITHILYANGVFEFSFTSSPGEEFTALATTNASLPLTEWTVVGAVPEVSPGHYQFVDPQVRNNPVRFYRVRSPH